MCTNAAQLQHAHGLGTEMIAAGVESECVREVLPRTLQRDTGEDIVGNNLVVGSTNEE